MEIAGIALRDIVLVACGLAGIYLVITLLRLVQVGRHKAATVEVEVEPLAPSLSANDAAVAAPKKAPVIPYSRAAAAAQPFDAELARSHQEMDLRQLREEVGRLREELGVLRGEIGELKAARTVSPQYADAMALAQRGLTAQDLADRCGIALGEAELVWALSRGPMNFDQEEDYDGDSGYQHARSA